MTSPKYYIYLLSTRKPRKLNAWSDGRSDRRKALPWIEIKLYLFNSFSEELNYLGSLSPYMRERAENDERYLGIETNHLRLLLGVSESLCNVQCFSWCHLCLVVDLWCDYGVLIISISPFTSARQCITSCAIASRFLTHSLPITCLYNCLPPPYSYLHSLEDAQAELEIMKSQDYTNDAHRQTSYHNDQWDDDRIANETSDHRREPRAFERRSMEDSSFVAPPSPPSLSKGKGKSGLDALFNLLVNGPCGSDKNTHAIVNDETGANTNDAETSTAGDATSAGVNRGLVPTPPATPTHSDIGEKRRASDVLSSTNAAVHGGYTESSEFDRDVGVASEPKMERRQYNGYIRNEKHTATSPSADLRLRPLEQRARQEAPLKSPRSSPSAPAETSRGLTTDLHRFARASEWQTLRQVLTATASSEYPFSVSAAGQPDENGRTPLMLACRHGSSFPSDVARLLLVANNHAASKFVAQPNGGELTCLHIAATAGCNLEVLETLLAGAPASIHMADENGNMPLHAAVNNGRYHCASSEANGALSSSPPQDIEFESKKANMGNIFDVIDEAPTYDEENSVGGGSSTFLGSATGFESHIDLVDACELLIQAYPDALLHRNRRGETPLILAMYRRASEDVISLLLRKGGSESVKISDGFGSLPLHLLTELLPSRT